MNREVCGQCGAPTNLTAEDIDELAQEVIERQDEVIANLKGESNVLASILRDAFEVIKTIEPENSDEEERLWQLRYMIEMAISPYSRRAWNRQQPEMFRNQDAASEKQTTKYCGQATPEDVQAAINAVSNRGD